MAPVTPQTIIKLLRLKPHPREGGYFIETYRSCEAIAKKNLPGRYASARRFATAIYYLLTRDSFSHMHRLKTDEMFHFYLGDPVEILHLYPDKTGRKIILGQDLRRGMQPQILVPGGVWQGSRLVKGGTFALLGTTMSPGFEFDDYENAARKDLLRQYPRYAREIMELTKK